MPPWIPYFSIIQFSIYLIIWNLFGWFKVIWRILNKTSEIPPKYARKQKIIFRYHRLFDTSRRKDFVSFDDGFISIEALKSPEWTIYSMDKKGVTLVELPNALPHYTIDKYPFIVLPIYEEAIRIAHLDLDGYISLCEELEMENNNKPPKTLFFSNTARCGSTLFGAMLQHDGYTTVFGEHPAIVSLAIDLKNNYWNENEINRLFPAAIKYLRKGIPLNHLFVYKCNSTEIIFVPYLTKLFPEMKHIFMFRKKGLNSVEKMLVPGTDIILFASKIYNFFYNFSPYFATVFAYRIAFEGDSFRKLQPKTIKEWAMIVYGAPYLIYKQNIQKYDFPIVWYDELMNSPETLLSPIFEKLDIPQSCIPDATARIHLDSQANTPLSQELLKNVKITQITPEIKKSVNFYANYFQMESDVAGLDE